MKAVLKFDLTDSDQVSAFHRAVNASAAYAALWEISQEIFRPARKHGYSDPQINAMLGHCGDHGEGLVSELEKKFYEILTERNIDLSRDWS